MMVDFDNIPSDVFYEIFSYIPRECLAPFALVSKTWNSHVTPHLYQSVELVWEHEYPTTSCFWRWAYPLICECRSDGHGGRHDSVYYNCRGEAKSYGQAFPSLYLLVRTIVSSPVLAGLVRHVRLVGHVPLSVWTSPSHTELTNHDRRTIRSLLCSGDDRFESPAESWRRVAWLTELDKGSPSAFAALLIYCLTNLRRLEIDPEFVMSLKFFTPESISRLSGLETVSVGAFRQVIGYNSRTLLRQTEDFSQMLFFHLSALRNLSLNVPSPTNHFLWPHDEHPLAEGLESLELAFTFMGPKNLVRLLAACPRLHSLKYDCWTISPSKEVQRQTEPYDTAPELLFDTGALKQALSSIKTTLNTFHLHISPPDDSAANQNLKHVSFLDFGHLTTLHIPFQLLLGDRSQPDKIWQLLPRSLIHLWLNDDGFGLWLSHDTLCRDENFPPSAYSWGSPVAPLRSDQEIVAIITELLAEKENFTPFLRSVKIMIHCDDFWPDCCWDWKEVISMQRVLGARGLLKEVDIRVMLVRYRGDQFTWAGCVAQIPPYFDLETLNRWCKSLESVEEKYDCSMAGKADEFLEESCRRLGG